MFPATSNETAFDTTGTDNKNFIADLMGIAMPNDSSAANTDRELVTAEQKVNNNNINNNKTLAKQEEEEDEEEGGGGLGGLLTSFLGSLSTVSIRYLGVHTYKNSKKNYPADGIKTVQFLV